MVEWLFDEIERIEEVTSPIYCLFSTLLYGIILMDINPKFDIIIYERIAIEI